MALDADGIAADHDGAIIAPPSAWLLRPLCFPDEQAFRLQVTAAPGAGFATGLFRGLDHELTGDLSIRDVTREITLDVQFEGQAKDPWGGERAGFAGSVTIDRREFGLEWNKALETGGLLVGEKVELTLEVEAVNQAAEKAA